MKYGLVVLLAFSSAVARAQDARVEPGRAAPEFTLKRLGGGKESLRDLRGHPVVINFWASWCEPCRAEMPEFVSAYRAHRDEGLHFLAINLTDQERRKDVARFVEDLGMTFTVLLDENGRVRERFELVTVPTTVFVDSTGVVRSVDSGPISRERLATGLDAILPRP